VRPVFVVVAAVDADHVLEMAAAEDEDSVEAVGADGSDPALGEQVPGNEIDDDQSKRPSLDHCTSVEPSEPNTPESRGRVCEPYAFPVRYVLLSNPGSGFARSPS
jgi:hypothetical protein